jgi:hypothetical protein
VNASVCPAAIELVAPAIVTDCSTAAVTVSVTPGLVTLPDAAVMLVVPAATPVATPLALIVAVAVLDDVHVTPVVNAAVVPLLYVPVAVYCCVSPAAMLTVVGVTAIDCSTAAVTVSVTPALVIPPDVAVILVVPAATPSAVPVAVPVIVAAAGFDDVHATPVVSVCVVPSLKCPVAVNASVCPAAIELVAPAIVTDCSTAAVTVSVTPALVIPPDVAVILVVPAATPVATPLALIVAVAVLDDVHVTPVVSAAVVPLL